MRKVKRVVVGKEDGEVSGIVGRLFEEVLGVAREINCANVAMRVPELRARHTGATADSSRGRGWWIRCEKPSRVGRHRHGDRVGW